MAVDTRGIPIKDVIELEAAVTLDNKVTWHGRTVYKGTCPFCGGKDRFAVFVDDDTFVCGINKGNRCNKSDGKPMAGDVITFLQEYHKWSFSQALDHLREQYGLETTGIEYEHVRPALQAEKDIAPPLAWQQRGNKLVKEAHDFLLSDCETARRARNYLLKRGIKEETIKHWKLGYVETSCYEFRADWGLKDEVDSDGTVHTKMLIPRGWLIPWLAYPDLWRIDIRRHPKDIEAAEKLNKRIGKYHRIKGSSDGLFNAAAIKENYPLIVVESPLDAIVGTQETTVDGKSEFVWCAIGATGGARKPQWSETMSKAYPILMAFDADSAGNQAFAYWQDQTFEPMRWEPSAHDINDMLLVGKSIMDWAIEGLEVALELDVLLYPEKISDNREIQVEPTNQPDKSAFLAVAHDLAAVFPDGCEVNEVDQAFADRIHTLPDVLLSPRLTPKERLCPFCAVAGRKASGVALVQQGKYHNQDVYKRLPERPFYYAWVESERVWWCPGCQNIQRSLPVHRGTYAA